MSTSLTPLQPVPRREPSIKLIAECAALKYGVTFSEMISSRRQKRLVAPRQIAMHLARKLTQRSFPDIGARLGGRDHTTVLYACRRVEALIDNDRELRIAVYEIETAVEAAMIIAARTNLQVHVDADAMEIANRVLDLDPHRISVDELRSMASFIRAASVPLVELGDATGHAVETVSHAVPEPQAPQPVLLSAVLLSATHPLVQLAASASAEWQRFVSAELSGGERAARATLTTTMLRLSAAIKEI